MSEKIVGICCRDCGALFYANSRVLAEDIPDIVKYALQGHEVRLIESVSVRTEFCPCLCRSATNDPR